jgi:predicted site-specific integrase-resolvase
MTSDELVISEERASDELVISEERAAEALGLSARTLQRWRVEGRGPAFVKLGKRVAYTRGALRRYVKQSERTGSTRGCAT